MSVCGRDCGHCCGWKDFGCKGCGASKGEPVWGTCRVAACCEARGVDRCGDCVLESSCVLRAECMGRMDQTVGERRERLKTEAPILGKWFGVLFWMLILWQGIGFLTGESFLGRVRAVFLAGAVLRLAAAAGMVFALWRLSAVNRRYQVAAWLYAFTILGNLPAQLAAGEAGTGATLLSVVAGIAGIFYCYMLCTASAEVLEGVNRQLGRPWRLLWKWNAGLLLGTVGTMLIVLAIPSLGLIVMLAAMVGVWIIMVAELVLLHRAGKAFRELSAPEAEAPYHLENSTGTGEDR